MSTLTAAAVLVSGCLVSFEDYPVGDLEVSGAAGESRTGGGTAGTNQSAVGGGGAAAANAGGAPASGGTGDGGGPGGDAGMAGSGGNGGAAQTGGDGGSSAGGGGAPPAGGAGGVAGVSGTTASGGVGAAGEGGRAGAAGATALGGAAGSGGVPGGGSAGRGGESGVGGAAGGGDGGGAGEGVGGAAGAGGVSSTAGGGGTADAGGGGEGGASGGGGAGGQMVGPETLVINEIDYDQESTDTNEFVELFNTSTDGWVDLTGIVLVLVNGASPNNQTEYERVVLSGTLGPEDYLVVASETVSVASGARVVIFDDPDGQDIIQNGEPDGLALVDTTTDTVLDALSYEGAVDRALITGLAGEHNLVEGTETTVSDENVGLASLVRYPNGQDTDVASDDWSFSTTPTPGAENAL